MDDAEAWAMEKGLWLEGPEAFERAGPGLRDGVPRHGRDPRRGGPGGAAGAPRWASVEMTGRVLGRAGDVVVLGYAAEGRREGAAPYRCLCTSTWRDDGGHWKLVQHQQTPVG